MCWFRKEVTTMILKKLDAFIQTLSNVEKVEVLPSRIHLENISGKNLGWNILWRGIEPPTEERIRNANELLHSENKRDQRREESVNFLFFFFEHVCYNAT